ncbi:MAG: hypothetical protein KA472_13360, partial [Pseudomonadales bacterium]|nr:hypothetical protein [Pseudomonadales bacterium]
MPGTIFPAGGIVSGALDTLYRTPTVSLATASPDEADGADPEKSSTTSSPDCPTVTRCGALPAPWPHAMMPQTPRGMTMDRTERFHKLQQLLENRR